MLTARREEHATPWETHMASLLWRALTVSDEEGAVVEREALHSANIIQEVSRYEAGHFSLRNAVWGKMDRLLG